MSNNASSLKNVPMILMGAILGTGLYFAINGFQAHPQSDLIEPLNSQLDEFEHEVEDHIRDARITDRQVSPNIIEQSYKFAYPAVVIKKGTEAFRNAVKLAECEDRGNMDALGVRARALDENGRNVILVGISLASCE